MNEFDVFITKGDGMYRFHGEADATAQGQAWTAEMVAAMREGLEANGFNVEAKVTFKTEVSL